MTGQTSSRLRSGKRPLLVAGLSCSLVVVLVWAAVRETAAEKEIKRLLAELRAAGEPLDAQDLARMFPDPPPEEDAAVLFAKALIIASNNPAPGSTPLVMSGNIAGTEAIDEATLQRLIAFCAATGEITNALPRVVPPGARFPMRWNKGMTNAGVMNFLLVRHFIQFMAAHIMTAAESGDAERAALMIEHGFAFSRTINYDGLFVTHMIRHACDGLICTVTERALNRTRFTDTQLQRIAGALHSETADDFRNCLRAEHCFAIWAFQGVAAGMPREVLFGGSANPPWWRRIWNRIIRRRPDYHDADFLAYLRAIPLRLNLSMAPAREMIGGMEQLRQNGDARSEVGEVMQPAVSGKMLTSHVEAQAKLACLGVALAVERARLAQSNDLPASLDALVPRYLPSVPADPFDARPLRFKKLPRGYVIYSVGHDGVDDGGMERPNSNATTNCDVTIIIER
jgi:hypothetical protein